MPLQPKSADAIRRQIAELVQQYAEIAHAPSVFLPGASVVPPSGKLIGAQELKYMVEASLDGWLTTGRFNAEFEKKLATFIAKTSFCTIFCIFTTISSTIKAVF